MPFRNGRARFVPVTLGILVIALAVSAFVLLVVPRFRWRVKVAELKATGSLTDISWKELYHMGRHGDPFNLKDLVSTRSPYLAIKNPYAVCGGCR